MREQGDDEWVTLKTDTATHMPMTNKRVYSSRQYFHCQSNEIAGFFLMWHRSSMLPMNSYPLHETCNTRYDVDPYCNWSLKFPPFRALVVKLLLAVLSQEVLMHHFPPGDPAEKKSMGWIRSREVSISIQGWTAQSFTYEVFAAIVPVPVGLFAALTSGHESSMAFVSRETRVLSFTKR